VYASVKARTAVRRDWRKTLKVIGIIIVIWVLLGLFFGLQIYANTASTTHSPAPIKQALGYALRRYSIYAVLTFPIVWLCRRFPPRSRGWLSYTGIQAIALTCFILLYTGLRLLTSPPVEPGTLRRLPITLQTAESLLFSNIFDQFWMFASIVVVVLTLDYYGKLRQRELSEVQMKRQIAEYELQILKLQLHPHFLFNTLNGISTLMSRDVKTAREMLVRLSELLRIALAHTSDREVSLSDEIEFVEAYLQLEQMRFGDRLEIQLNIEPETLSARVPHMILQPLIENAIRHGVARVRSGGSVALRTSRVEQLLRITVRNDGPPLDSKPDAVTPGGLGLGNTRARLWQLYGDNYRLRLANRREGGVELSLEIPFAEYPSAAEVGV
jgi:two-component system LytT family sensor kinase